MNIAVRMYNVGFGDCFLVTIPAPDRPRKILIDCGKHTLSATGPKMRDIVDRLLADITEDSVPRVDVIVATHRHQDHVSGFALNGWESVRVGEVWMPWTEDPDDAAARDICDRQSTKAARAHLGLQTLGAAVADQAYLLGYASNNLTNAAAMNLLHRGFQTTTVRRFLPDPKAPASVLRTALLPGVDVHVLGPSRDPDVLREMDPPDEESFFRAWSKSGTPQPDVPSAFDPIFTMSRLDYDVHTRHTLDDDFPPAWEARFADATQQPAMELLARIEEAVNATSLVLLFHIGDAWLLFPGDAQWGTWNAILNQASATKLLGQLSFYKIGHHGSHNATPISFVERFITANTLAMLPYGRVDKWPSIPRPGLIDRLERKQVSVGRPDAPVPAGYQAQNVNGEVFTIDVDVKA